MRNVILVIIVSGSLVLTGCSSWQNAIERTGLNFNNSSAQIVCYSGGQKILDTVSIGKVTDDEDSDGFFFKDQDGKFKEVNADCIFTYK